MDVVRVPTSAGSLAVHVAGEGPPVVLLHGIPGTAETWRGVAERLAGSFRTVMPDLLGFGESDRPGSFDQLSATGQAVAVEQALAALDVPPSTVVGHDFGGPVALALVARDKSRARALGLLATNAFPDTPIPFPLVTTCWPLIGQLAAPMLFSRVSLRMMLRTGQGRPRVQLSTEPRASVGDRRQSRAIRTIFEQSLRNMSEIYAPLERSLREWDGPVLIGWGERDPFFSLDVGRRTADAARSTLTVFPGAGHFLPEERPAEVAEAVAQLALAGPRT